MLKFTLDPGNAKTLLGRLAGLNAADMAAAINQTVLGDLSHIREIVQESTDFSGLRRRTGTLVSGEFAYAHLEGSTVNIDIGATAPYAGYLERGTSRVRPYRFLRASIPRIYADLRPRISAAAVAYLAGRAR